MAEAAQKRSDPKLAAERLDWYAFLARFFPNRRRHDFAAVAAYVAYTDEFEPPTSELSVAGGREAP
ncbi:MAG TPA: hypothetical protein VKR79_00335 [Gaiellaceae bacterium]|nr:hypothetical protein [Gaiellaceae bacterium]